MGKHGLLFIQFLHKEIEQLKVAPDTNQGLIMKTRIFNLIILDESGSMLSIKKQAVDGVNETIQTICAAQQKHEEQEHRITLVTFNSSDIKTIYDRVEAGKIEMLPDEQYEPNCCTPLYDAMGISLLQLRKIFYRKKIKSS